MTRKTETQILYLLGLALWIYAAMRAWMLPITHDEASTMLNHVPRQVIDMIFYIKDSTPNNHVLNTLLIKTITGILGTDHFTARIPALLGGAAYLWASVGISQRISVAAPVRWFTFVILTCNPYLLEFFGLARGYALSVGLMLFAIERAMHYFDTKNRNALVWTAVLALLSVEANFTLFNVYVPLFLLISTVIFMEQSTWTARWQTIKPLVVGAVVLAVLSYKPMTSMAGDGQLVFWGQGGFFEASIVDLMRCSTDNYPILGENTKTKFAYLALLFTLACWWMLFTRYRGRIRTFYKDPTVFFSLLFIGTVMVNFALFFLFKVPFVNGRTALFFLALFALQMASAGAWLWETYGKAASAYLVILALLALSNLIRLASLSKNIEWWFDIHTFKVVEYLKALQQKEGRKEPYTLDASPVLLNSFLFHTEVNWQGMNNAVKFTTWHPRRLPSNESEFFFCMEADEKPYLRDSLKYQKVSDLDLGSIHELYRRPPQ